MTERKPKTNRQRMVDKTLHRNPAIQQHESH